MLFIRVHGRELRAGDVHAGESVHCITTGSTGSDNHNLWNRKIIHLRIVRASLFPLFNGIINH